VSSKKSNRKLENDLDIDEEAREDVEEIEHADIVVGIPSYNSERTIGHVIKAAEFGLAKYFPNLRAVLVNSDGGSTDRTKEIVKEAGASVYSNLNTILIDHPVSPAAQVVATYNGIPGKGSALRAIFEISQRLGAKVTILLDADLRSINPEWIEALARPILRRNYDFVAPYYSRHKYDGTITNMVIYPLTRALYGKRIRQPIGGDFGVSRRVIKRYLEEEDGWDTNVARFGIDIWMTTVAINEFPKICQAFLGAKIHDAKDPSKSLEPMFRQVVGTVFELMKDYEENWKKVEGSAPTAMFGFVSEVSPEPIDVSLEPMITEFKEGLKENGGFWSRFLSKERMNELGAISALDIKDFFFPAETWVKVVYDFAVAYNREPSIDKERLVETMAALYFGRTASFVIESWNLKTYDAERLIEEQCLKFEELKKPYLIEKWG